MQPIVVEQDTFIQVCEPSRSDQVEGKFTKLSQIEATNFSLLVVKHQRLIWDFPISDSLFICQIESVTLYFGVFEWFWDSAAPDSQIVVGNHRVEINRHVFVLEVSFLSRVSELSVIPVHDVDSISFTFT